MAQCDGMLLQCRKETRGFGKRMNHVRPTTDLRERGLGLQQLWWFYMCRWITLSQNELHAKGPLGCQLTCS